MFNRLLAAFLLILSVAGCSRPEEVHPALYLVEGAKGEKAWLFGTIHALPAPVRWRSQQVGNALGAADRLILEVAAITDDARTARAFAERSRSPGLPPLDQRIPADLREELAQAARQGGIKVTALDAYETWAAALMLQNATAMDDIDTGHGIDRALARSWPGKVEEFEGADAQLAIFDGLPEVQQRALLGAVLTGAQSRESQRRSLQEAWGRGDMDLIARVTDAEFAAEPHLREALLTARNRAWVARLEVMLGTGAQPFVAVGAAHLAGADGLPAMLAARGWKVRRLQ